MQLASPFAGIVYPDATRACKLIEPMARIMGKKSKSEFCFSSFQNFEMGRLGGLIVEDPTDELIIAADLNLTHCPKEKNPCQHILDLYKEHREKAVSYLSGDFAFALFDKREHSLFLARDRIGKKPLFWSFQKEHFFFASEIKALLATGLINESACHEALSLYLYLGYFPQDMTPIVQVHKLLPGHTLFFHREKRIQIANYWSLSRCFSKKPLEKEEEAENKVKESFSSLFDEMLPSTIAPLAYFDEGALAAKPLMVELAKRKGISLRPLLFHADKTKIEKESEAIHKKAASLVWDLDLPIASPMALIINQLFQEGKEHYDRFLCSLGSEKLFSPYSNLQEEEASLRISRFSLLPEAIISHLLIPFVFLFSKRSAMNLLRTTKTNPWEFQYVASDCFFSEGMMQEALPLIYSAFSPDTFLHKFYNLSALHTPLSSLLYLHLKTALPDGALHMVESLSKAQGVAWNSPFTASRFIEILAPYIETFREPPPFLHLPHELPHKDRTSRGKEEAIIDGYFERRALLEAFHSLGKGTLVESGLLSRKWLQSELNFCKDTNRSLRPLWSLFILEKWFNQFIDEREKI